MESRIAELTERADPFMAWLGIVFALVVGYDIAVDVGPRASLVLLITGWVVWSIFVAEFALKVWVAPRRLSLLRRNWVQVLALAVPTLRVLRLLRLVRLGRALPAARVLSSSYRAAGTAKRLLRSRLAYLAAVGAVIGIAVSELAFVFERDEPHGIFDSFGDCLIWGLAVVIALQGDPVPQSTGARIAMLLGFVAGLVIIASVAGMVGTYLIEERRERAAAEGD